MAINDITGDALITRASSETYRNNYDAIFRKDKSVVSQDQKSTPTDYVEMIATLEQENRQLHARNQRLEQELEAALKAKE